MRGINANPSIVAGLRAGRCVAVFGGDWNLQEESMKEVCTTVQMYISEQFGGSSRWSNLAWDCYSSCNNRDWIVTFSKQGLMHPNVIPNSEEHLRAYGANHLNEHQPVVLDFGRIRSPEEQQRSDAPAQQQGGTTAQDYAEIDRQVQERQCAYLTDAREKDLDPEDPATTSTATTTTATTTTTTTT